MCSPRSVQVWFQNRRQRNRAASQATTTGAAALADLVQQPGPTPRALAWSCQASVEGGSAGSKENVAPTAAKRPVATTAESPQSAKRQARDVAATGAVPTSPAMADAAAALAELTEFTGREHQEDDVSLMVIRAR